MDGQTPSGFTDTPVGTGVGQFPAGTQYVKMADPVYPITTTVVEKYDYSSSTSTVRDPKDVQVFSLLDAMIKAQSMEEFGKFIEYNPWILFVWIWFPL